MTVRGSKLLTYEIAGLFNISTTLQPPWVEDSFVHLDAYVKHGFRRPTQLPCAEIIITQVNSIVNIDINKCLVADNFTEDFGGDCAACDR